MISNGADLMPDIASENLRRIMAEIEDALKAQNAASGKESLSSCAKKLFEFSGLIRDERTLQDILGVARMLPDNIKSCRFMKSKTLARCTIGLAHIARRDGNRPLLRLTAQTAKDITVVSDRHAAAAVCADALRFSDLIEDDAEIVADAVEMAKIIAEDSAYESIVCRVVETLAGAAVRKKSLDFAHQANELIGLISTHSICRESVMALSSCSAAYLTIGVDREDVKLVDEAAECARNISNPNRRSEALLLCAETLFQMGQKEAGTDFLLESIRSAEESGTKGLQARMYSRHIIVIGHLVSEYGTDDLPFSTLVVPDMLKSTYLQCQILTCQAEAIEAAGGKQEALDVLEKAIQLSREIDHDYDKTVVLRKTCEILLCIGSRQKVVPLISKVQEIGQTLRHVYLKNQVLEACETVLSEVVTNNKKKIIHDSSIHIARFPPIAATQPLILISRGGGAVNAV